MYTYYVCIYTYIQTDLGMGMGMNVAARRPKTGPAAWDSKRGWAEKDFLLSCLTYIYIYIHVMFLVLGVGREPWTEMLADPSLRGSCVLPTSNRLKPTAKPMLNLFNPKLWMACHELQVCRTLLLASITCQLVDRSPLLFRKGATYQSSTD